MCTLLRGSDMSGYKLDSFQDQICFHGVLKAAIDDCCLLHRNIRVVTEGGRASSSSMQSNKTKVFQENLSSCDRDYVVKVRPLIWVPVYLVLLFLEV